MKSDNFKALQKRAEIYSFVTDNSLHAQLCIPVILESRKHLEKIKGTNFAKFKTFLQVQQIFYRASSCLHTF
jgi:hypothetical protein